MQTPGYELLEKIGEGGEAEVWRARQQSLDRIVAIKLLRQELSESAEDINDFINEARTAAAISNPNLVGIYDISVHDGQYFIVMEYVEGHTLGSLIRSRGALNSATALKAAHGVISALDYAWERAGLIHCDIKPDNIMLDAGGTIKLADLGIARHRMQPERDGGEDIRGTPNYMAPEQITGDAPIDCRTDMYALGATLYHIVTGVMPFEGEQATAVMHQQVHGHVPSPRDLDASVPRSVAHFIARLMMKDPAHRFASWRAVRQALKKAERNQFFMDAAKAAGSTVRPEQRRAPVVASGGTAPNAVQASLSKPERKPNDAPPALVRALLWLLLLAALGGLAYWRRPQSPATPPRAPLPPAPAETVAPRAPEAEPVIAETEPVIAETEPAPDTFYDRDILTGLLDRVALLVCQENFPRAIALLNRELGIERSDPYRRTVLRVQEIANRAARLDALLAASFQRHVGQDITLRHNGRSVTVHLRAVAGQLLSVVRRMEGAAETNTQHLTIPIDRLAPEEQARWLGPSESPEQHVMHFILYCRAGQFDRALEHAPHCGPLAEALAKCAKTEMQ